MKQITEVQCVCCSNGCALTVDETEGFSVTGNRCEQGARYARSQLDLPTRTVKAAVKIKGAAEPRCLVMTSKPIPKEKLPEVAEYLSGLTLESPVWPNQVLVENICGTGADLVSCRSM